MGLLLPHICTLEILPDMLRIKSADDREHKPGGRRGRVTTFSKQSRKRMFELLHSIQFSKVTFVTLTYPRAFSKLAVQWKMHLRRFRARLQRKYGRVMCVWKLEFQKRGAPHFHLMLFDAPFIDRDWLSNAWYRSVGSNDERHLRAGTNIEGVAANSEHARVVAYVSKYMAKVYHDGDFDERASIGRVWGIWNRRKDEVVTIEVSRSVASELYTSLCRGMEEFRRYKPDRWDHCTIYGSSIGDSTFAARITYALQALRRKRE